MPSLSPSQERPLASEQLADQTIDRLRASLQQHGLALPSLRSDLVTTGGRRAGNLGTASTAAAIALAEVLDRTAWPSDDASPAASGGPAVARRGTGRDGPDSARPLPPEWLSASHA